jgi:hypothetical protein
MIETDTASLSSALYGITRLVAGYQDWRLVQDIPDKRQWLKILIKATSNKLTELNEDILNADPKEQGALMRKLTAYQQLALIEKFCFDEVEW